MLSDLVKWHLANIYLKLGVRNRTAAVKAALAMDLVQGSAPQLLERQVAAACLPTRRRLLKDRPHHQFSGKNMNVP